MTKLEKLKDEKSQAANNLLTMQRAYNLMINIMDENVKIAMTNQLDDLKTKLVKAEKELNYYIDLHNDIPSEETIDMLHKKLKKEHMFIEISDEGFLTLNKETNTNSTLLFNNPLERITWNVMTQEVVTKTFNADLVIDKELLEEVKLCYNLK